MPEPRQVRSMFARIAGRYDLLNRVLSAGIDQRWRRAAVSVAENATGGVRGRTVVDVCCGTGDLSLAFADAGAHVLAVDFTPEMLAVARQKRASAAGEPLFAQGDAMRLPFTDAAKFRSSLAWRWGSSSSRSFCSVFAAALTSAFVNTGTASNTSP
jgi:demethylmenaquinone methyltransferase/2-methoxy-6-polyprenyl-1,4-benzoquinol methylase